MSEIAVPDYANLVVTRLELEVPTQTNRSGWTGARKGVGLPGAERWYATVEVADIGTEEEERPWRAFLFGLRGTQNRFRMRVGCQNVAINPVVGAGSVTARSIPISGMPANSVFLPAGSFLTIPLPSGRYRTVCLLADLIANGAGKGIAQFEPEITETPAGGAVIEAKNPFVAVSPTATRSGLNWSNSIGGFSLDVEEAA